MIPASVSNPAWDLSMPNDRFGVKLSIGEFFCPN